MVRRSTLAILLSFTIMFVAGGTLLSDVSRAERGMGGGMIAQPTQVGLVRSPVVRDHRRTGVVADPNRSIVRARPRTPRKTGGSGDGGEKAGGGKGGK